tara:strand:+ start:478 stop:993 length:516 start_codon:yes stop_codon:yes gene_type:complete
MIVTTVMNQAQQNTHSKAASLMAKKQQENWAADKHRLIHGLTGRHNGRWQPNNINNNNNNAHNNNNNNNTNINNLIAFQNTSSPPINNDMSTMYNPSRSILNNGGFSPAPNTQQQSHPSINPNTLSFISTPHHPNASISMNQTPNNNTTISAAAFGGGSNLSEVSETRLQT